MNHNRQHYKLRLTAKTRIRDNYIVIARIINTFKLVSCNRSITTIREAE